MDLEKYKQVLKDAIQSETEARTFYENVSKRIKDDYLKELFDSFAGEEAKHAETLTDILNHGKLDNAYFDLTKDFHVSETIEMPEVNDTMDLKSAIGLAMKNEEIAMKKYTNMAGNCKDPELKSVFSNLAAMESGHKRKMEEIFINVAYPEVW